MNAFARLMRSVLLAGTVLTLERFAISCVALLLAALTLANVYRAWTQSITYDEAVTYDAFVAGPISNAFTGYNANNHVLYTVLAKATTAALGPSDFSLRLPSVVAGAVYFGVVFALCRLLFGHGVVFLTAIAALALNPFILDFLSAARGYGLALALLLVAFHQVAVIIRRTSGETVRPRQWIVVSLALAGSVSANLAFVFPAMALGLVVLLWAWFDRRTPGERGLWRFSRTTALPLCGPGIATAVAFLVAPLSRAEWEHFTYGAGALSETTASLVEVSVRHHSRGASIDALMALVGSAETHIVVPLTLAVLLVTAVLIGTRAIRARPGGPIAREDRMVLVLTGTLAVTLAALVVVHRVWAIPYPLDRTGLYFIPLFILGTALVADRADVWKRGSRIVRGFSLTWLAILIVQSVTQLNLTQYALWSFDAGTRTLHDITTEWPDPDRDRIYRIAASSLLRPSLEYYRRIDATSRVASVSDGLEAVQPDGFDFAMVSDRIPGDVDLLRDMTRPVCSHPVSGAMLAVSRTSDALRSLSSVRTRLGEGADCERVLDALR